MFMPIQLGVHIGPAFSEFCLLDVSQYSNEYLKQNAIPDSNQALTPTLKSLGYQRTYSPSESVGSSLKKFLASHSNYKIDRVIVATNLLEKILETKLGGSVAQVITAGFENWPYLRQSLLSRHFEMQPQRTEALSSQELIFSVKERIDAQGKIISELSIQELEELAQKLSDKKIEKVCINFLFSGKNPVHLKKAEVFFKKKGFDVYSAAADEKKSDKNNDEILSWRKNLLNASLSGTFKEIKAEVLTACGPFIPENQIFFFDGNSNLFQDDFSRISSSLFGPAQALTEFYRSKKQVLVLGTEKWYFLKPQNRNSTWQSPWGPICGEVPYTLNLKLQPTTELVTDLYDQISWGQQNLGYEPGPMSFGRSLNPTLLDILQIIKPIPELNSFTNASGIARLKSTLTAILKHSKSSNPTDLEKISKELCDFMIDQIGLFVLIERETPKEPVLCTGVFAPVLMPLLRKRWPEVQWDLCPYSREIEAMAIATRGQEIAIRKAKRGPK